MLRFYWSFQKILFDHTLLCLFQDLCAENIRIQHSCYPARFGSILIFDFTFQVDIFIFKSETGRFFPSSLLLRAILRVQNLILRFSNRRAQINKTMPQAFSKIWYGHSLCLRQLHWLLRCRPLLLPSRLCLFFNDLLLP